MTAFGKFARDRVKVLGKSQKALAAELGVSPAYISQVFTGKKNPPDLGRPKCRLVLRKWSRFLATPEEEILDMVRYDLHSVPLRPAAKYPVMRELLVKHVHPKMKVMAEEIRSMTLHPGENRVIETMVEIYVLLQEDVTHGSAHGPERFKDFCRLARSNREFVERDLVGFFREQRFTWSWDTESGVASFRTESPEVREALQRSRAIIGQDPRAVHTLTIPVVGHVSAGTGFEFTDGGFTAGEGFDQVAMPPGVDPAMAGRIYCVRVRGDSLRDFFCDGALLFIKPESWEEIRDGDLVIFKDRMDRKAFVKKVEFAGENLILKSMNSLYKNMVLHKSDLILLERVTAIVL
jgi:SOS-response transcriptional repressor LexA/transcriptional regulator with XRE-family HTH domain